MEQTTLQKIGQYIKNIFTKNKRLKLFYLLIIIFLCYAPSFCDHTKITTPSRDAYYLYELAQSVETEEELRYFEHEYHGMELAYRNSYNDAAAIKFRLMTQSVAEEAAARRNGFRTMEDAEIKAEQMLTNTLDDFDAAWEIELPSEEAALEEYTDMLDKIVATHMEMRATIVESIDYYNLVVAANYPQYMLDEHSAITDHIEDLESDLNDYRVEARHYNLAYKLKYGDILPTTLLLERYIDAFDGRYTRINAGVGYGDVEYILELLDLVNNSEEMTQVQGVMNAIYDAYIADGEYGYAELYSKKLAEPCAAVEQNMNKIEEFEYVKADFDYVDWDALWAQIEAERGDGTEM